MLLYIQMTDGSNKRYLLPLYHSHRKVMSHKNRSETNFEMYLAKEGLMYLQKLLPKIMNCISVRSDNHIWVTLGLTNVGRVAQSV